MRRLGAIIVGVALLLQVGCYSLVPTGGVIPTAGTRIALSVNDAGRAVLGGVMGPEIDRIEGTLLRKDSVEFVVAVTDITTIRGAEQQWSGETVHVKSEFVTGVFERRLSKEKTLVAGAIGVGALVYILTRTLQGSGFADPAKAPTDTAQLLRRHP